MQSPNHADDQLTRLKKRLDREQRARVESESIAEKALSELYTKKKELVGDFKNDGRGARKAIPRTCMCMMS